MTCFCGSDAVPRYEHCYRHLTVDQRAHALRSDDPAVRGAATAAIRERAIAARAEAFRPPANPAMVCPHCQVRGRVTTERIKVKRGISGGKATGAVLTAGLSLFGTGLSRKEYVTRARCGNCHQVWTY